MSEGGEAGVVSRIAPSGPGSWGLVADGTDAPFRFPNRAVAGVWQKESPSAGTPASRFSQIGEVNVLRSKILLLLALATGIFASSSAGAVLLTTTCGPSINSIVRTENAASVINAVAFVNLPGAVAGFTVPAGQTRCIKVVFTGEAACRGPAAISDFCFIRALDNGVEMSPQGAGAQVFLSEDPTENAHAYEWVRRVRAGNHSIVIQRRVGNAATGFLLDDWTFDLQIYN